MEIGLAVFLGGFFGLALYLAGATITDNIQKMLRMTDLTLAKVILFAIGLASVLLAVTSMIGIFDFSHYNIKGMNLGVVLGGLLFGVGFGMIGRCPGTCVGALGGRYAIFSAVLTIIGGLLGAFTYAQVYGWIRSIGLFDVLNWGKVSLFHVSDDFPSVFGGGYVGLLLVGVVFMAGAYFMPERIRED